MASDFIRHTYTYAILEVSPQAYAEISEKIKAAGYGGDYILQEHGGEICVMQGIAIQASQEEADGDGIS